MATAKTLEQKALHAARQRAYRERQKLIRAAQPIPAHIAPKRAATYRPPTGKATEHTRKVAANNARVGAAQRASEAATVQREIRAREIEKLPQVRNPKARIFVGREPARVVATGANARDAAAIRRAATNQKIQAVGRGLQRAFRSSTVAEDNGLYGLDARDKARFEGLARRVASVSPQALAIYYHHEGGSGEFTNATKAIRYPVDGSDGEEGFARLEALVKSVETAEALYGEKALGYKLNV